MKIIMDNSNKRKFIIGCISAIIIGPIFCLLFFLESPVLFSIVIDVLIFTIIIRKTVKVKLKVQQLTPSDFGMNKQYYRDIIEGYSPIALSYIDNFKTTEKDIYATFLKLQKEKYIEIDDKKNIKKLKDSSYELKESEKYIMQNQIYDNESLKEVAKQEALNQGLIEKFEIDEKKYNKKIIILILIFIISIITLIAIMPIYDDLRLFGFNIDNINMMDFFLIINKIINILLYSLSAGLIIGIFYPICRVPYLLLYKRNIKKGHFVRTKKGNEINEKLEGLKNYIKHYSMLNEKDLQDLKLWEDYLIYSVMFGQNQKIINELKGK